MVSQEELLNYIRANPGCDTYQLRTEFYRSGHIGKSGRLYGKL